MGSRADQTKQALIEALVRLLKERSLQKISVRDVAAEAGVNHGLVHRYFGSKRALVHAAVERVSEEIHRGDPVHRGLSASTFRFLRDNPHLAQLVARACLDGPAELVEMAAPTPQRLADIIGPVRRLLDGSPLRGQIDPHVLNGLASAAFLGWFVFKPLLESGFGLPEDADEQLAALLDRLDVFVTAAR